MGSGRCVRGACRVCIPSPSGSPVAPGRRPCEVRTAAHACCLAQVVRYEAGYVVCAVIAGLYLLVVPIAGLCFCCCRCCRRCGGRVKTEHKAVAWERGTLAAFLLLTTLVLL